MDIEHLTLPTSIDVERDPAAETVLYDEAREFLTREERTEGIHASDLLFPRKGHFRQVDPQPLDERQVGLFLVGKVLHAFILRHNNLAADEGSRYSEELGLWYSPDLPDEKEPAEIKTSRSWYEPKTLADLETYLHQLLIYLAAMNVTTGRLWVLYINAKDENGRSRPAFRAYKVTLSREELEAHQLKIRKLRDAIADSVTTNNPKSLPLCAEWACGPKECPWFNRGCKPEGRHGNPVWLKRKEKK